MKILCSNHFGQHCLSKIQYYLYTSLPLYCVTMWSFSRCSLPPPLPLCDIASTYAIRVTHSNKWNCQLCHIDYILRVKIWAQDFQGWSFVDHVNQEAFSVTSRLIGHGFLWTVSPHLWQHCKLAQRDWGYRLLFVSCFVGCFSNGSKWEQ